MKTQIVTVSDFRIPTPETDRMVHRSLTPLLTGFLLLLGSQSLPAGVILTFDHSPPGNFVRIDQNYGDRVTISPDAFGHQYGFVDDGFGATPNVALTYGGSLPSIWTTGYGDLVNVLFNDQDGDTSLNLTLTADSGFEVGLFGFDVSSFSGAGQTIPGLQVLNSTNNGILFSQGTTFVTGATHNDFDFSGGLFASSLTINIDLTGLGTLSDNIAIDNVYFIQREVSPVPLPAALLLFGSGLAGLIAVGRSRKSCLQ